jgi:hypothetical protein
MGVWYWGGRYIPWLARLVFFFWAGAYVAWRFLGFGSTSALLTGAVVVLAILSAGEVGQFRSRREAVLRREADPRQFDAIKSEEAALLEAALAALGFTRRGDCVSTKGNAIVRRRIFVNRGRRSIVAALFHTCALIPAAKGTPNIAPEERSVGPTSLSMISYGMNGSLVRSRSTAPGEKPMRPIPRELLEDFSSSSSADLLDAHAQRLIALESRDRTRMIDVDEWSAFALADAIDDAWARRIESFGWTPMAYRMLVADYRWFRDLAFLAQAAVVRAIIALGPGLFYFGHNAFSNRGPQNYEIQFRPTAAGAHFDVMHPPIYPGATVQPGNSVADPGESAGNSTSYIAPAAIETVRRWYEDRMPADARETMGQVGGREYFTFAVQRSNAVATLIISQDSPAATDVDVGVRP